MEQILYHKSILIKGIDEYMAEHRTYKRPVPLFAYTDIIYMSILNILVIVFAKLKVDQEEVLFLFSLYIMGKFISEMKFRNDYIVTKKLLFKLNQILVKEELTDSDKQCILSIYKVIPNAELQRNFSGSFKKAFKSYIQILSKGDESNDHTS